MSFRLLHLSDPHFGAHDRAVARAAVETAVDLKPDLTVVSGDFSMRGRRSEFVLAREWVSQLPRPLVTFPGNHDVPGLNHLLDRFFSPFHRYREYISAEEEPVARLRGVGSLFTANSSTPFGLHVDWSRGFLSPFQGQALESHFANSPPGDLRVFGMHHPVVGTGDRKGALVSPMPMVSALLERAGVDLVLAGHLHQSKVCLFPESGEGRRLVVSQSPSVCSTRLKGEPNGFHLLDLSQDRIAIELRRWHQDHFPPGRNVEFGRVGNGWEAI